MNHIEEMLKLLPILESAMTGGVITEIEAIIGQVTGIFGDLKAAKASEAPTAAAE